MDPEQTFLRVHARLSGMLAQLLSPRVRSFLEHICLVIAVLLLSLLAVMHVNFVSQAGCANELSRDKLAETQLLQIKMVGHGLWSHMPFDEIADDVYISEPHTSLETTNEFVLAGRAFWHWVQSIVWKGKSEKIHGMAENLDDVVIDNAKMTREGSMHLPGEREATFWELWDRWTLYGATWLAKVGDASRRFAKFWRNTGREFLFSNSKDSSHAFTQKAKDETPILSRVNGSTAFEPVYLYSIERGYLLLPEHAKHEHNVQTVNLSVSARNPCFGNRLQQLLINSLVGYDTILMNSLLVARGEGYLYNYQTKELYDLNYPRETRGAPSSFQGYLISKCGVLIMSLFVFFTTTMSVSFTLRETQARMLKFTVQLQYHARHRLPTFHLIFIHVIESLVFVPIMIGILFFLFEFYEDQLLAFMVLTLVWLCELFTMISVRTPVSMQYFPRYFFLYFMVFHIYFFSYEYGFSYLAFSTTAAFMQHLVLYFWNHFEVPALQRFLRARIMLQQQPGVHITSSAIITSTVHVTRLATNNQPTAVGVDSRTVGPNRQVGQMGSLQSSTTALSQAMPTATSFVDRVYAEHLADAGQNFSGSTSNMNNGIGMTTENQGVETTPIVPNTTSSPDAANFHTIPSNAPSMSSFGSILLWILGGPLENIATVFPNYRDSSTETMPPDGLGENAPERRPSDGGEGFQRLRRRGPSNSGGYS